MATFTVAVIRRFKKLEEFPGTPKEIEIVGFLRGAGYQRFREEHEVEESEFGKRWWTWPS